jgi:NitT/TauT family transport system ATP-binding protein
MNTGVRDDRRVVEQPALLSGQPSRNAGSGAENILSIQDVTFRYDNGLEALSEISLDIPRGQVTAIVGPSGCGKSTLLKLMVGLLKPNAGVVEERYDATSGRHPTLMVFQQDTLLPWLRVRDNVALYHHLRGSSQSKAEIRARVDELLRVVGLDDFGDAYPKQLSGGMRRRVAFLAGVAPEPQLLLLDEPFSAVDEPTRVQIHQEVHGIIQRGGMTVVLVTHDLAEAISLADQVVILSALPGQVAEIHEISLGAGRDVMALRHTPEFLELYGSLWDSLSREIIEAKSRADQINWRRS